MRKPEPSMAELRAQLSAALANYRGPVTHCAPAPPPDPDREVVDLDEQGEVDEQIVPGTVRHAPSRDPRRVQWGNWAAP